MGVMSELKLQHSQLPNGMGVEGMNPQDQLVYVYLRSFMNNKTMEAYPSLRTIAGGINASINTVRKCIDRLVEKGYISIRDDGKKRIYKFEKLIEFEPFSKEFLENPELSFNTKSYLAAAQQYMYTDEEGVGKLSLSNRELSKKINVSEFSIRKYNEELQKCGFLNVQNNEIGELKVFQLNRLGQAIVWVLKNHEERISATEDDVELLKFKFERLEQENQELRKRVNYLLHGENTVAIVSELES